MKRTVILLITLMLIFTACAGQNNVDKSSTAASTQTPISTVSPATTPTPVPTPTPGTDTVKNPDQKYTLEFPYLLTFKSMVMVESPQTTNYGFVTAKYKIDGSSKDTILDEYEKLLLKDGWKTTSGQKPTNLKMEKDNHVVILMPATDGTSLFLNILSK